MRDYLVIERLIFVILLAGCCITPWFFGGNRPAVQTAIASAVAAGLLLLLISWIGRRNRLLVHRPPLICWLIVAAVGLGVAQTISLPANLLRVVSPAASDLWIRLVPDAAAVEPAARQTPPGDVAPQNARWYSVSLYPLSTRRTVFTLCVCLGIVMLVTCNPGLSGAAERLDQTARRGDRMPIWLLLLVAANGVALALFGLIQQAVWNGKLYGVFPLIYGGTPFGPFINRNNAGGYLNICLGCAIAVVWYFWTADKRSEQVSDVEDRRNQIARNRRTNRDQAGVEHRLKLGRRIVAHLTQTLARLNGRQLASIAAVVLIASGIGSSLSRGATLAMLVGILCLSFILLRRSAALAVGMIAILVLVVGFLVWLDRFDPLQERIVDSAVHGDLVTASNGRLDQWRETVRFLPQFWVTGTGLGTYRYLSRVVQERPFSAWWYHVENQYLEAAVELGLPGLVILIVLIALVLIASTRLVFSHHRMQQALGIAGLYCITTQIVASAFDFGLYLPANMFLMATISALVIARAGQLNRLIANDSTRLPMPRASQSPGAHILPIALSTGCILIALSGAIGVMDEIRAVSAVRKCLILLRNDQVDQLDELPRDTISLADRLLHHALEISPRDAEAHRLKAEIEIQRFRSSATDAILINENSADASTELREETWPLTSLLILHRLVRRLESLGEDQQIALHRNSPPVQTHLVPARRHFQQSRESCPTFARVHFRLAQLDCLFGTRADEATNLKRALLVDPCGLDWAFWAGIMSQQSGDLNACCHYWRRSLELTTKHERQIVQLAAHELPGEMFAQDVLPDDLALLLRVGQRQLDGPLHEPARVQVLHKARELVRRSRLPKDQQHYLLATIERDLGHLAEADAHYSLALEFQPNQVEWRAEYAELLMQREKLDDAIQQYVICQARSIKDRQRFSRLLEAARRLRNKSAIE